MYFQEKKKPEGSHSTILETLSMCSTTLYIEQPESTG